MTVNTDFIDVLSLISLDPLSLILVTSALGFSLFRLIFTCILGYLQFWLFWLSLGDYHRFLCYFVFDFVGSFIFDFGYFFSWIFIVSFVFSFFLSFFIFYFFFFVFFFLSLPSISFFFVFYFV